MRIDVVIGVLVVLLVLGLWLAPADQAPPPAARPATDTVASTASPGTNSQGLVKATSPPIAGATSPSPALRGAVGDWWEREREKNRRARGR